MKYKCIRKCHHLGRKWNVGDVFESDGVVPYHFVKVSPDVAPSVVLEKRTIDPMKPHNQEAISALSQFVKQPKAHGFASSLPEVQTPQLKKPDPKRKKK